MLEHLSEEDILRTIDSLRLSENGETLKELTEEDYKLKTSIHVDGETLVHPDGTRYGEDPDREMFLYDLSRGK